MNTSPRCNRRSIRLSHYDYSQPSAYFVTICVKDRKPLFGNICNGEMLLSPIGNIACTCWKEIPQHFDNVELDEFVVMPNHLHGIIVIKPVVGVQHAEPRRQRFQHIISQSLGAVLRSFKSAVTRLYRQGGFAHFAWQRNYYEHIIRNPAELKRIQEYILANDVQWQYDRNNPLRLSHLSGTDTSVLEENENT